MSADLRISKVIKSSKFDSAIQTFENDIVYIGGSIVEGTINPYAKGMGNKYSDFDVFVIRDKDKFDLTEGEYKENGRIIYFSKIENEGLDIEVINAEVVKEIISEIMNADLLLKERILNVLSFSRDWNMDTVNELLTRHRYSIPVKNKEEKDNLINRAVFDKFTYIYKYFLLNVIDNLLEDIRGNIDSKAYETALLITRKCCIYMMSYCLYCNNEFVDRDKWVWLKFSNFVKVNGKYTKLYENIKTLLFSNMNDENIEKSIDEYLYTAEKIIEEEMIGGLDL